MTNVKQEIYIVSDSAMRAQNFAENAKQAGFEVLGIVGTVSQVISLPDGANILVFVEGDTGNQFGACATARQMIARGNFNRVDLNEGANQ